jgi:hypothetical protein
MRRRRVSNTRTNVNTARSVLVQREAEKVAAVATVVEREAQVDGARRHFERSKSRFRSHGTVCGGGKVAGAVVGGELPQRLGGLQSVAILWLFTPATKREEHQPARRSLCQSEPI